MVDLYLLGGHGCSCLGCVKLSYGSAPLQCQGDRAEAPTTRGPGCAHASGPVVLREGAFQRRGSGGPCFGAAGCVPLPGHRGRGGRRTQVLRVLCARRLVQIHFGKIQVVAGPPGRRCFNVLSKGGWSRPQMSLRILKWSEWATLTFLQPLTGKQLPFI